MSSVFPEYVKEKISKRCVDLVESIPAMVLFVVRPLRAAADNLHLVCDDSLRTVVHFEGDILDQECPHFITEPIGVKRTLLRNRTSLVI